MLRARERRRRFDAEVYVGDWEERRGFAVPTAGGRLDRSLRVDLVCSLLERLPDTAHSAWLTRPGAPDVHDLDLAWLSATATSFGIMGRRLVGFYAITRSGWLDIRTGERREWKRLRL